MQGWMMRVLLGLALLLLAVPVQAATYNVSLSGNNSNSCATATSSTPSNAKRTINAGISCLASGDTLLIGAGSFPEIITTTIPSGSGTNTRTIIRGVAGQTIINPSGTQGTSVVQIGSGQYLWFDQLILDGTNFSSNGSQNAFKFDGTSANFRVSNSEMRNFRGLEVAGGVVGACKGALVIGTSHGHEFLNNNVHHNTGYAYYIQSNNNLISGGEMHDNDRLAMHIYADDFTPTNNTVTGVKIYNNGWDSYQCYSGCIQPGGVIWGADNTVYNNILWNNGDGGWGIRGSNTRVWNETIYSNRHGGPGGSANACGMTIDGGTGTAYNNIIVDHAGGTICGSGMTTAGNYTGATPGFVNAASNDFHLTACTSCARNAGSSLVSSLVTTDIVGVTRPQEGTYDAGAYEYSPAVTDTLPVVTITTDCGSGAGNNCTVTSTPLALGGTASDDHGVNQVTWACTNGCTGSGTATCASCSNTATSVTWSTPNIALTSSMTNRITVTARDSINQTSTDTIDVTLNTTPAGTTNIYVSPSGDDSLDGTQAHPFRTLEKARDVVRTLRGSMSNDIYVNLRGGRYERTSALQLNANDGGTNNFLVIWQSFPGEIARISGAVQLSGWTTSGSNVQVSTGGKFARQLYVNGLRGQRAQQPNTWLPSSGFTINSTDQGNQRISVPTSDLAGVNPTGGEIMIMAPSQGYLGHITGTSVSGSNTWLNLQFPPRNWSTDQYVGIGNKKYKIIGPLGYVDQGGEWHIDKTTFVATYRLRSGESVSTMTAYLPQVDHLVQITGTAAAPVRNIQFKEIRFEHTADLGMETTGAMDACCNRYAPGTGGGDVTWPGQVVLSYATNVSFDHNVFRHSGGSAIEAFAWQGSSLVGNVFHDISAQAIWFKPSGDSGGTVANQNRDMIIRNNYITNIAAEFDLNQGVAIWSPFNYTIDHNTVEQVPRGAFDFVEWTDFDVPTGNISITRNLLHHQGSRSRDYGCIYSWGFLPNSTMQENYWHHCQSPIGGDFAGFYCDGTYQEPSTECGQFRIENNAANTDDYDLFLNHTSGNTVINSSAAGMHVLDQSPGQNTYQETGTYNDTAVKNNAGLETAYKPIIQRVTEDQVTESGPTVAITTDCGNGAGNNCTVATATFATLAGTAQDPTGIQQLTWTCNGCPGPASNQGGTASCTGCGVANASVTWTVPTFTLGAGTNTLNVTATNVSNQTGNDNIQVTLSAPQTNPLAYWPLDSNANDAIDGHHGNLMNGATLGAGKVNGGAQLGTTNGVLSLPDRILTDLTAPHTVCMWAQTRNPAVPDVAGVYKQTLINLSSDGNTGLRWVIYDTPPAPATAGVFHVTLNPGTEVHAATTASVFAANTWAHVCDTYSSGTLTLYVNGAVAASTSVPGDYYLPENATVVGGRSGTTGGVQGAIDEVKIWNRALTVSEIATEAGTGTPQAKRMVRHRRTIQ